MLSGQHPKVADDFRSGSQLRHLGQQLSTQGQRLGVPKKYPRLQSNRRRDFAKTLIGTTSSQAAEAKKYVDAFAPQIVPLFIGRNYVQQSIQSRFSRMK